MNAGILKSIAVTVLFGAVVMVQAERAPLLLDANGQRAVEQPSTDLQWHLHTQLRAEADRVLQRPIVGFRFSSAGTLLETSRAIQGDLLNLSLAYRATRNPLYLERARQQMRTAAAFPHWNPVHFLDTAEMALGLALGYEWLESELSAEDKAIIQAALVEKALQPALQDFRRRASWTTRTNNWAQVCGSGIGIAALVLQEEQPVLAAQLLPRTRSTVLRSLASYRPDGVPEEGPTYWRYGMVFQAMYSRAMVQRFGERSSLFADPVYRRTALYPIQMLGPTGLPFNFGDSSELVVPTPALVELARATQQPAVREWVEGQLEEMLEDGTPWINEHRFSALFLAWNDDAPANKPLPLPLDLHLRGDAEIAMLRSSWDSKHALYVGIKGGRNGGPHGQLDLGSFVLDQGGVRWAIELGKDSYSLPGYFNGGANGQRWTYLRNSTMGHNTPIFGRGNQSVRGSVSMTSALKADSPEVTMQLAGAWAGEVRRAERRFVLDQRRSLVLTDTVQGARGPWAWQMLTRANVETQGNVALLRQDGKTMRLTIETTALSPLGSIFQAEDARPNNPLENPNLGVTALRIYVPSGSAQIRVRFELLDEAADGAN